MDNYTYSLDAVFHALSDATRRAVVQRLGRGPASVKDLAEPFDMALSSFMKHIGVLERSGLIRSEKRGRVRTCRVEPKSLALAEQWAAEQRAIWQGRFDRLDAYVENIVNMDTKK